MPHSQRIVFGALIVLALGVAGLGGLAASGAPEQGARPHPSGAAGTGAGREEPDGRALYLEHCAPCHGERGFGDGEAAYLLYPKPRDFSVYNFRLVSTENGVPTDQDLFDVVTRGMLGSAMPPHHHLTEAERRAVVRELRRLMTEEGAKRLLEESEAQGEPLDAETARAVAFREPGEVIEPAPEVPPNPELLAEGRISYMRNCALCHDSDGSGRSKDDLVDSQGRPLFARDFTAGIMKGGTSKEDLWRRIRGGMPGTPMPALDVSDRETWALVHYVRSLIRPGAQERLSQKPLELEAVRVEEGLDADPAAAVWDGVPARWVAATPLWWREPRVPGLLVQAAHDGERLALRLVWEDATRDVDQSEHLDFSDAAAVQWSARERPPFFAMGAEDGVVDIWYWRAVYQEDLEEGFRDVATAHPRIVNDVDHSLKDPPFGRHDSHGDHPLAAYRPLFITAWGAGNPVVDPARRSPVSALEAEGFGTLSPRRPPFSKVRGRARHERGFWELVLIRELDDGEGRLRLGPFAEASVGFAVWNGAAGNRNGDKNVTIWHRLRIAP